MGGGLTWFRYQVETPFHPKTQRLALILQVSDVYASGILVTLWSWAIRFAPDGDLTKFGAEFIEQRVLDGRSGVLAALGEVGFMDASGGRLVIHDWDEYQGAAISRLDSARAGSRERQRRWRERQNFSPSSAVDTPSLEATEEPPETLPPPDETPVTPLLTDITVQDSTVQDITEQDITEQGHKNERADAERVRLVTVVEALKIESPNDLVERLDEWRRAYPDVDLRAQFEAMTDWLRGHPSRTYKTVRFIPSWLSREQRKIDQAKGTTRRRRVDNEQQLERLADQQVPSDKAIEEARKFMGYDSAKRAATTRPLDAIIKGATGRLG